MMRLGSCIRFKQRPFFAFRKKNPLSQGVWGQDLDKSGGNKTTLLQHNTMLSIETEENAGVNDSNMLGNLAAEQTSRSEDIISRISEEEDDDQESKADSQSLQQQRSIEPEAPKPAQKSVILAEKPNLDNFMKEFQRLSQTPAPLQEALPKSESFQEDKSKSSLLKGENERSAMQGSQDPLQESQAPRLGNEDPSITSSQKKVDFLQIGKKEDRESSAQQVLQQALMMAPPF